MKDRHELRVDRFLEELDVRVPWNPEIPEAERQEREKELRAIWLDFLRGNERTQDVRLFMKTCVARIAKTKSDLPPELNWNDEGAVAYWVAYTAPNWNDERAVADWVARRPLRLVTVYIVNSKEERHRLAIEDAKAGDFYALEDMIRSGERLSAEARELIANNLGKVTKKKPDPRKLTHELSKNPDAERAFVEIEYRLKQGFPERSNGEIKDRAFALAAEQFKMNEETLRYYEARSAGHPRRLSPKPEL
jgi:hypothetical protein